MLAVCPDGDVASEVYIAGVWLVMYLHIKKGLLNVCGKPIFFCLYTNITSVFEKSFHLSRNFMLKKETRGGSLVGAQLHCARIRMVTSGRRVRA
jgi:hypothetical protein